MEHFAKQTYIYLALKASLTEIGIKDTQERLTSILIPIIEEKIRSIMTGVGSQFCPGAKIPKYHLRASSVFDSEFPFEDGEHQKFQATLYHMDESFQEGSEKSRKEVAILEVFSSEKMSHFRRKSKSASRQEIEKARKDKAGKRESEYRLQNRSSKKSKL